MALTRRLQVLLDEERFARLERRAQQTGASVGALVRRAIDETYPPPFDQDAAAAAESFLAADPMPVDDWDIMKRDMRDSMWGGPGD
jgi:hypothetical protein